MRLLLLIMFFYSGAAAQSGKSGQHGQGNPKEVVPEFKNEGEQEEYYVKKLFREQYRKQYHKKYSGTVRTTDKIRYQFDSLTMTINYTLDDLREVLDQGILSPALFNSEDSLAITDLNELKYVAHSPTYKRFSFWLFRKWLANPQVYYIELTNEKAGEKTNLKDFIKGARLTYFKAGNIIL